MGATDAWSAFDIGRLRRGRGDRHAHLTAAAAMAIDQGTTLAAAGLDLDGEAHDRGPPDLGADER